MIFEFELSHEEEGVFVISEPDGWKTALVGLERHPDFHSLVEYYKSEFSIYGSNGTQDGGREWIKNVERLYGPDALIKLNLKYSDADSAFKRIFLGQVPIGLITETLDRDHTLKVSFSAFDFWTKFVALFKTPVNIQSPKSFNGEEDIDVIDPIVLTLPSQKMQKTYRSILSEVGPRINDVTFNGFVQGTPENIELDEIEESYDIFWAPTNNIPAWFLEITEAGTYHFDILISCSASSASSNMNHADPFGWYVRVNETDYALARADFGAGLAEWTQFTIDQDIDLKIGDKVILYCKCEQNFERNITIYGQAGAQGLNFDINPADIIPNPTGLDVPTYVEVVGQTVKPDSSAPGFLLHDVAAAICDRILGRNGTFYSEHCGSPYTQRVYENTGCAADYMLFKGMHVRGYTLAQKSFFHTMEKWWNGANPIFNLGLGYAKKLVDGIEVDVIEVEEKAKFYDASGMSTIFYNVRKMERAYDDDYIYNLIINGYKKWESEEASGIDDAQTEASKNTLFKNMGKKIELLSEFIAGSISFEATRRKSIKKSADYKYDDESFIVNVIRFLGAFKVRINEGFSAVNNLLNADTRYNKILTCGRNFLRWRNFLNGCVQQYLPTSFFFAAGKGNYDMQATLEESPCKDTYDGGSLDEHDDIPATDDFLFFPIPYTIYHYMTIQQYESILANRKMAVGVSQTNVDPKKMFIKQLEYNMVTGVMKARLLPKELLDIQVPDVNSTPPGGIFDESFDDFFE